MEWVDCVRAGQHLWLCVVQDSGSGQPLVGGQCCGSQLGNTFDWFDSSSSHNYWARNNEIIPTFFKPLRICFCSIEHSQSKTLDIKCNMKTTLCSKVHCFIIDLRTTRMFSHLYITSKVLKNISISITHGFVSIVSCRAEPSLAPSITTHHHCAESAENGHSLKTIEGLIWNKRSFCSHGPITDYSLALPCSGVGVGI